MRFDTLKRALALLLAVLLFAGLLAGCGKDAEEEPSKDQAGQNGQTEDVTTPTLASEGDISTTEDPAAASSGDITVRARDVTVAVVAAGRFGEDAWADSALYGASQVEEAHSIKLITLECGGADYDSALENAAALADIVVCVGEAFANVVRIAPQHLGAHWIWLGGNVPAPADNLLCVDFNCAEAGFLAGWAAAKLSKNDRIGVVRGDSTRWSDAYEAGFARGAAVGDADVRVELRTGSDARLLQYTLELAELKAEPILVVSEDPEGVVLQTVQEENVRVIVASTDAALRSSEQAACVVTLDFGVPVFDALLQYLRGDLSSWGTTRTVGLADSCISLQFGAGEAGVQAKDALRSGLEELLQKIQSGEILAG